MINDTRMSDKDQRKMFGTTIDSMHDYLTERNSYAKLMWAMSVLSDSQEFIRENPEMARQLINQAKFALTMVQDKMREINKDFDR